jgi:hypothetical protein
LTNGNITIGDGCFAGCPLLETVNISTSVTTLVGNVFISFPNLKYVTFDSNSSVTSIGNNCFQNCTKITSLTIPGRVTSLGNNCFQGCSGITSFTFDDQSKLVTIGTNTFSGIINSMNVSYYLTPNYDNLSPVSQSLQTQFPPASTFTYYSGAACFNEGTKILCLNKNFEEEYIPVENLRKGDFVKSYKHGYRKIELIGKNLMINNPKDWKECMYKMEKTETNGLTEDLTITGYHSILVDDLQEYQEENEKNLGETIKIDEKYLLLASVSKDFVKLENTSVYTYYHFILENNGNDDERFGVYANGILTETPSKNLFNSSVRGRKYNVNY